jgi:tRNA threonylcarbamoyladenosine biosynthesis protein TsaB
MSIILAIETSSELASAALLRNGVVTSAEAAGVVTHSQSILPMVQSLLADANIKLADCDAIAFGSGPGSFTGVRTACGIAQGLAYGSDLPVLPTVTLLALAQACHDKTGARDILTVLDARMGEVYWAQYKFDQTWQIVVPPTLSAPLDVLPIGEVVACGNGLKAYVAEFSLRAFFSDELKDWVPHAGHIAHLGAIAFSQGLGVPAMAAEPLYLRNKIALTTNERLENAAKAAA